MLIYNKIAEKFKFIVPFLMHWKNIIVDSVDSSLPREDPGRSNPAANCLPDDEFEALVPAPGSVSSCQVESTPTEVCHYTTGDSIFKIGDHVEQIISKAGELILEVS